jgi:hypothetical protein
LKIIRRRWRRDDPYTNESVIITIGSVQTHEMTTEGAGIGTKGTQGDMKVDPTNATINRNQEWQRQMSDCGENRNNDLDKDRTGRIKPRLCPPLHTARKLRIDKTGGRKT